MNFQIHTGQGMRINLRLFKCIVVMKLTLLFITAFSLQVSAYSQQPVTLNYKNAPLQQVMQAILKQTGYGFIVDAANLKLANPVTINLKEASIEETLRSIFSSQPFVYHIEGKSIIIQGRVEKKSIAETKKIFPEQELTGIVTDDQGRPLEGATIIIKGPANVGTITDKQGHFRFTNAPENGILLIRMIGRETKQINYQNSKALTITLKEIDADLKEIQVIAYGEVSKKFTTSNIGTIKGEDIAKQPISNPLLALQGRVPGLFLQQSSGVTAGNVNVVIQGANSLQNKSDPFYVIDGIPYTGQFTDYTLLGTAINGVGGSTFNFINPADIESISILKDADATAIYGSRAANGAILITTKKGKAGQTKVNINLQNGWGKVASNIDLLNTQQYLEMRREGYKNAGQPIPTSSTTPTTSNYDLTVWDQSQYTDWQKELVGGTAKFTDLQASVSGGNLNTQFLVGYGYNRQTTVYPGDLADVRGNLHFNLNHNSNNNKFKYTLTGTYLQDKNELNGTDLMSFAVSLAPNAPSLYNPDGSLNWGQISSNPSKYTFNNPLAFIKQRYDGNTNNLTGNNTISYEFIDGLNLKTSMGYNKLQADETTITPLDFFKPDEDGKTRSASYLTKSISSWIIEPQLTYVKNTKFGAFDAILGGTFQQTKTDVLWQTGSGYSSDTQLDNILAASSININAVSKLLYKYNALFGRLNYRFKNKYILNLTARRDGSSRFGDENKLNTFYAIGGAWLFGDEAGVRKRLPWLSSGKLRVNYGTTGNDQIPDYTYLSLLETYRVDLPYQDNTGLYPTSIYNPFLQWEETRKLNFGLDLGFWRDRIQVSGNYFRNRSSNQLITYLLPTTTGFPGINQNFPAIVQNTGIEAQLNASVIKSNTFNWQSSINITVPRNKLVAFPGLESSPYASFYVIGQPINVVKAYKFSGVNPTTGLYEVINNKGEKTSSPNPGTDKTVMIDVNPKYYGGFSNSFSLKGVQLDFLFLFVKQMASNFRFGNLAGIYNTNQPVGIMDRWKAVGDVTDIQRFNSSGTPIRVSSNAAKGSDAGYSGASYVRLKNISLSYSLPSQWISRARISQARIYMQGQNLLTITNFIGSDPETKTLGSLPPLRVLTFGIQLSL
jgi:TonB-linked SusC/RagA family outer membrane protein